MFVPFLYYVSLIIRPLVAFKVYDVDRDGFISNGELFLVLKMMVGNNLKVPFFPSFPVSFFTEFLHVGPTTTTNRRQDDHGSRP